jgi:hypothetical protein
VSAVYVPPDQSAPQRRGQDGFAVASLVLGILWIFWIGSILAVVFGHLSLRHAKREHRPAPGLAIAGLILGYIGVATLAIVIATAVAGAGSQSADTGIAAAPSPSLAASPAGGTPVASTAPAASSSPAVTKTHSRTQVVFTVTGSAPNGADITYGSDSDNRSPQGGLGALGSGTALPWQGSVKYRSGALYYDVTAQLQGGGDITCKVRVRVTQFYSDGTHISRAKTVASGHASGGYNICDAQAENF